MIMFPRGCRQLKPVQIKINSHCENGISISPAQLLWQGSEDIEGRTVCIMKFTNLEPCTFFYAKKRKLSIKYIVAPEFQRHAE